VRVLSFSLNAPVDYACKGTFSFYHLFTSSQSNLLFLATIDIGSNGNGTLKCSHFAHETAIERK
jgi:hypothetical protein